MPAERLNREVLRRFWANKAQTASNRWTGDRVLEFELAMLRHLVPAGAAILDLGSGHGELSRKLCPPDGRLVAVDWEAGFSTAFTAPQHSFVTETVTDYEPSALFDVALLFGVVTSLELREEEEVYDKISRCLKSHGVAVVKNQCANADEFVVDGYSEALGTFYSGRYPSRSDQLARLTARFGAVEPLDYPADLNPWPESGHVAFLCHNPASGR